MAAASLGFLLRQDVNHLSLLAAQTHLIAHQLVLHRVLQRSIQQHFHRLTLDESHFYDTLAESAVTLYLHDDSTLTRLQFREFHTFIYINCCKGSNLFPHLTLPPI